MATMLCIAALVVLSSKAQAQYTLTADSLAFTMLDDSLSINPSRKSSKYGLGTNQFGMVVDSFYGTSFELKNFMVFGHLVDSVHISHNVPAVHFELLSGKKASLSFKNGNQLFGNPGEWSYDVNYMLDSINIRLKVEGLEGSRVFTFQYLNKTGHPRSDTMQYEIQLREDESSFRVHYDKQVSTLNEGPILLVPYYKSRILLSNLSDEPKISRSTEGSIQLAFTNGGDITNRRYKLSLVGHCSNGIQDFDETEVDCGGRDCHTCTCNDGIRNNTEADVDCGGTFCQQCPRGSFPVCNAIDSLAIDTLVWRSDTLVFSTKQGYRTVIDSLLPYSTYLFSFLSSFSFVQLPVLIRPSDGEILEVGGTQGMFYQSDYTKSLQGNTDSTGRLIFQFQHWIECSASENDSITVRLTELSDSSKNFSYPYRPKLCLVTYDSIDQTDVVAYEDYLKNEVDTIIYALTGTKVTNFTEAGFLDLDTGEQFFVRQDTNLRGAFAQYRWDAPRTYNFLTRNSGGVRSSVSAPHSIIAVTASLTPDTSAIHVTWTGYKGFKNEHYYVYRQYDGSSPELLDSVPFSQVWYDDSTFNNGSSNPNYFVELPKKVPCKTERAETKRNYNSTRSRSIEVPTMFLLPPDTTGLHSNASAVSIRLFPNPTSKFFEIESPRNRIQSLRIMDQFGRLVHREAHYEQSAVSIQHFASGIYFVEVLFENNQKQTLKLIKQ